MIWEHSQNSKNKNIKKWEENKKEEDVLKDVK